MPLRDFDERDTLDVLEAVGFAMAEATTDDEGTISVAEIAKRLRTGRNAVSDIVSDLDDQNLVLFFQRDGDEDASSVMLSGKGEGHLSSNGRWPPRRRAGFIQRPQPLNIPLVDERLAIKLEYSPEQAAQAHRQIEDAKRAGEIKLRRASALKALITRRTVK